LDPKTQDNKAKERSYDTWTRKKLLTYSVMKHVTPLQGLTTGTQSTEWFASVHRQSWEHRHVSVGFDGESSPSSEEIAASTELAAEQAYIAETWMFPGFVLRVRCSLFIGVTIGVACEGRELLGFTLLVAEGTNAVRF
jgi:hypothetical protein